ncbi:MAG: dynamin family protein [Xenococcus sp. MO_188.B8]|nr:dynamin family protein [Xenococcus sp. MO_188.B8]
MSNNIRALFASIKEEVIELSTALRECCSKINGELPPSYESQLDPELTFTFLDQRLVQSVDELCYSLDHPTLILATTGTTSSGKSTLINLLCGAEIVPTAVQEMSAGVVIIEYSREKALKIDETNGAEWECGRWTNISDEDIYSRLNSVMKSYLKCKKEGKNDINCPQSTIYYPFRLISEPGILDLPDGTIVKIMDLPGLAHVGDEGNAKLIRKSKEALCLVTYNSSETDRKKVDNLLQEVVNQVKELGGSPARMLFILNRIDEFRKDRNWRQSEQDFFDNTGKEIRQKLKENLEEFSDEIDSIKIIKLSSLPAILSLLMINGAPETKTRASELLKKQFNFFISDDLLDDLPSVKPEKWKDHDRKRVYEEVWPQTYAENFFHNLKLHIQDKYPQLIIPQILKRFQANGAYKFLEWASQTTNAIINSSEEHYESECKRIQEIRKYLDDYILKKEDELKTPFNRIEEVLKTIDKPEENDKSTESPLTKLEKIINGLEKETYFEPIAKRLKPLSDWPRSITEVVEKIATNILDSLDNNQVCLDSELLNYANYNYVYLLEGIVKDLIKLNYSQKANKEIKAQTEEEKAELEALNRKLNELAKVLKLVIDDIAEQVVNREMYRVRDALEYLLTFHLESLEADIGKIVPELSLNFPQMELVKVEFTGKPNFSFEGGFPVLEDTYEEEVDEKIGRQRVWWTVWIWNKEIYETKIEMRSIYNASIPSIESLAKGWKLQKDRAEIEIFKQVADWYLKQLDNFNNGIKKLQKEVIDRYQSRLNQAYNEIKLNLDEQMEIWEPLKDEIELISEKVNQLGTEWTNIK